MIFIDYSMPDFSGPETTKLLSEELHKRGIYGIPMIGCTAHIDETIVHNCEEAGMVDVLIKPVLLEKLREALLEHCYDYAQK
mmetsp:Transcript_30608/g.27805  ORF Transcript_30608/g.27805 Transcript_30608/m.27805 type:complete len:82 (-) Transcript_30608:37-282(-)